jgi:hypothetical protein
LADNLKFLPEDVAARFIEENDLVRLEDGSIMTRDNFENPPPF